MQNPFSPKTQKALSTFGGLIRAWSRGDDIPPSAIRNGDRIEMTRMEFMAVLNLAGLSDTADGNGPADFEIRNDIQTVELIIRRPDCFSLLLPEPSAVADLNPGDTATVQLPAIYEAVNPDYASTLDPNAPATRAVVLSDANYEAFLDPYMAGYCCTQCH